MHVLHIVNSYGGTEVYKNLVQEIDKIGIRQTVYVPLRRSNHNRVGNHMIDFSIRDSEIIYSKVLKSYHRFFYELKIKKIVNDICNSIDLSSVSIIHASTLCLDGAVAYELHCRYNIPYIVAVRNTDLSAYYKYFFWERKYFNKVALASKKIIFISPKYKSNYLNRWIPFLCMKEIQNNALIIPNGVNKYWLENKFEHTHFLNSKIRLVFASAFVKGKGLKEILEAVEVIKNMGYDVSLKAIGKGLPFRKEEYSYLNLVEGLAKDKNYVELCSYMKKEYLIQEYRNSDIFIMPSKPETFGLVYVEALTQGLPILYAEGEGFDGYYKEGYVGYAAKPFDVKSIVKNILLIIDNYETISRNIYKENLSSRFNWESIAQSYNSIYNEIIQNGEN